MVEWKGEDTSRVRDRDQDPTVRVRFMETCVLGVRLELGLILPTCVLPFVDMIGRGLTTSSSQMARPVATVKIVPNFQSMCSTWLLGGSTT
jgi:hypothetical protein